MGDLVNLNKARKTRVKTEAKKAASANRVLHGLSKEARALARAEQEKTARLHEQTRRDPSSS